MRVSSRIALVVLAVLLVPFSAFADHLTPECALSLVASNQPASSFALSPHGVFRSGNLVYVLRGQTLSTYTTTDTGEMQLTRDDFIGSMASRETNGGVAFSGGFLYVSGEAGLEIYDLRNVRAGGGAPLLVSRTAGLHYRRIAVSGNQLAGLYPATDLPCSANGQPSCFNTIDLLNIANPANPFRVGTITSLGSGLFFGFNDIAYNFGFLIATSIGGTYSFNIANPAAPSFQSLVPEAGTFLVSNGTNLLGVGGDSAITTYTVSNNGVMIPFGVFTVPAIANDRQNPVVFHPQAFFDDQNGRLVTMVDELDPQTLRPARTLAFDVFDFTVPFPIGSDPRPNETISYISPDEVKWNPVVVGPLVYVVGEMSGLQTYGSCGNTTGKIEFDGSYQLICGGTELHGWVTGTQKVVNVELFLDNTSLGTANLNGPLRTDVSSRTPVNSFRVNVNFDTVAKGDHTIRAIATDALGNRRQFASVRVFFNGPGLNCTTRRRVARS